MIKFVINSCDNIYIFRPNTNCKPSTNSKFPYISQSFVLHISVKELIYLKKIEYFFITNFYSFIIY